MEMGREQPSFFGSLAWALARQSNLVRLACQRGGNVLGYGQPANLARSRCGSMLLLLLLLPSGPPRHDRELIDSCEDANR